MKRYGWLLIAGALLLGGCGKPGVTVTDANGNKVTMQQDTSGGMTVTDDKGNKIQVNTNGGGMTTTDANGNKSSWGVGDVSEKDLGVPFYPSSQPQEHGDLKADTPEQTSFTSMRTTSDPAQKVVDFYKDELTKAGYTVEGTMVSGEVGSVSGKKGDADVVSVTFTHDSSKNTGMVMLSRVTKKGGAAPSASSSPSPSPS